MKKLILASAVSAAFVGGFAQAEEAAKSDHAFSFNVGATSDYRFRGISQSRRDPAISAGIDYSNTPTGLYIGAWASSIKWVKDNGGDGNMEVDIYGGKRGEAGGIAYDVGFIHYNYPNNKLSALPPLVNANTTEVYTQVGYGVATLKYSYALTNFIGWGDNTDGSDYIDLNVNPEISDGYVLNLHVGKQRVKNYSNGLADYTDWKIGVTKDFGIAAVALAVVGTDADKTTSGYNFGGRGFTGNTKFIATVTKTF
jgi:uncharacterized protein (TIGR02001 family)